MTSYVLHCTLHTSGGKNTEEYKRILTNLEAIVSTLEGLPSASQTLRRKMCEKSWISPTANPLKDNLMSAVLGRVQMEAAQFHEFVALLRDIAGLGPLVCRLTGGFVGMTVCTGTEIGGLGVG